jgi:hypothetical protein
MIGCEERRWRQERKTTEQEDRQCPTEPFCLAHACLAALDGHRVAYIAMSLDWINQDS